MERMVGIRQSEGEFKTTTIRLENNMVVGFQFDYLTCDIENVWHIVLHVKYYTSYISERFPNHVVCVCVLYLVLGYETHRAPPSGAE